MIKQIVQDPHPFLRKKAKPLDLNDEHHHHMAIELAEHLVDTLKCSRHGVGLAAPQIGVSVRMIHVALTQHDQYIMVNPMILKADDEQLVQDGCLSVSGGTQRGLTKRAKRIKVVWTELNGTERIMKFSGVMAAIIQHEIDHLDGILFTDKLCDKPISDQQSKPQSVQASDLQSVIGSTS